MKKILHLSNQLKIGGRHVRMVVFFFLITHNKPKMNIEITEKEYKALKEKAEKWDAFYKAFHDQWFEGYNDETDEWDEGYGELDQLGEWLAGFMKMPGF